MRADESNSSSAGYSFSRLLCVVLKPEFLVAVIGGRDPLANPNPSSILIHLFALLVAGTDEDGIGSKGWQALLDVDRKRLSFSNMKRLLLSTVEGFVTKMLSWNREGRSASWKSFRPLMYDSVLFKS